MGVISVNQAVDGSTAVNAASINTNFNTIANVINGNLDDNNIAASAAINASKIAGGTAGMFGSWTSWTPTWSNLTVGSGTVTAKYIQFGKTVFFRIQFLYGSGSAVGTNPTFSLPPVPSVATPNSLFPLGPLNIDNNSSSDFNGFITWASTTTAGVRYWDTNNNSVSLTATAPFTFAANTGFYGYGMYEAA